MSDKDKNKDKETKDQGSEPEKDEQIAFGTERPNPFRLTNSEDRSKKPRR
jgi:hypothetical protein